MPAARMMAMRVSEPGGPEVMLPTVVPVREPDREEVRIVSQAAGVNFIDVMQREGRYPHAMPFVPGVECAGVIDAVGDGVHGLAVGDRVAATNIASRMSGGYATHVCAHADGVLPVPDDLEAERAAAVAVQGLTAYALMAGAFPVAEGMHCLVHAAAGGVGQLLVQLAKLRGASVIGTASTQARRDAVLALGADHALAYDDPAFVERVHDLTGGGVHVVFDPVGHDTFESSLTSLRRLGVLVLFGEASGPPPPLDTRRLRALGSVFVTRISAGDYLADPQVYRQAGAELFEHVMTGRVRLTGIERYALERAGDAHAALRSRSVVGKLVLIPGVSAP